MAYLKTITALLFKEAALLLCDFLKAITALLLNAAADLFAFLKAIAIFLNKAALLL